MTRRASILCTVLFVSVMIFVASQAWAVVVDMTVKDTAGSVPDMEITFTPEDKNLPTTTGRTDTQGKVVDTDGKAVVLPPGKYGVSARGRDHVTSRETVTIGPGETASFSMTVDPIMPWMVQNPPCSLCLGLGAGYYGQSADDMRLRRGETEVIRIPGLDPIILLDASAGHRFDWSLNAGTGHIAIGVSTLRSGNLLFYPALNFQAGGADLTIDVTRQSDGVKRFSQHGSGTVVGAGVGVVATCPNCSWYLGANYDYWTLVDADLERNPCSSPDGFTDCRSRGEANSHSHAISSRFGLNLLNNRFSPFVGIKVAWQNTDVRTSIRQVFPELGEVTVDTSLQLERDTVEGIAGVDARIWGPLFSRLETTFNGSDVSVMFKIIYGLSWVDP